VLPETQAILLVDDNPDDRFLVEHAWREAGIRNPLRSLGGGRAALDYLSGTGAYADRTLHPFPSLVLLDIKMPDLSGLEVLERLRRHETLRRLPVLMMTASTLPSDVAEAYRLGANGFFIKPSSVRELTELLAAFKACWLRFNAFPSL
jgi:CheY-like chemotaxis protein